jgi:hypothetical protein
VNENYEVQVHWDGSGSKGCWKMSVCITTSNSSWTSAPVRLEAAGKRQAEAEAKDKAVALITALRGAA